MKGINGNPALDAYQRVAVTAVNPTRAARPNAVEGTSAVSEQAAKLSISTTARELASQAKPAEDSERIAELKAKVEQGNFQFNPQLIASRMIDALA